MFSKYLTRRDLIKFGSLSFLSLLSSCGSSERKIKIILENSFYPKAFQDAIPNSWQIENINIEDIQRKKNFREISDTELTLVNDGWLNRIDFNDFIEFNNFLFEKLDKRAIDFLKNFEENQKNKLFPIGVVPYAIIIKNNRDLINSARRSWDFLLSEKLSKKIIFPQSPRLIISIAKKIKTTQSLAKLKNQAKLFDDRNSLNWLINSDACVAIVPYSNCSKYLKIDSRLSIVFPKQGVPLIWYFALSRSNLSNEILLNLIKLLKSKSTVDKLSDEGWYLPIRNDYSQTKYKFKNSQTSQISGPSQECWTNSWSLPPLTSSQKLNLENYWNQSSTP